MIIYIDLLIILNFIIDLLLLISVDVLLKRKTKFKKIVFGSLVGSLSTILVFYISNNILLLFYKLLISVIMIVITFKYQNFKVFKDNLFWLYIISIIFGGTVYLFNNQVYLSNHGMVFSANGLKINALLLLIVGPVIIFKYIKSHHRQVNNYSNYYDVEIYYCNGVIKEVGYLDTGNKLVDPYFGRPIILVNKALVLEPLSLFYVPYDSVNNHGLLPVFKPQKMVINKKIVKRFLIGLSDVDINGVKIILNMEVI